MKKVRITTDYAGCPYITPGKVYPAAASNDGNHPSGFWLEWVDDNGDHVGGNEKETIRLGGGSWTILPDEPAEPAEPQINHAEELAKALEAAILPLELYKGYGWPDRAGVISTAKTALTNYRGAKK